MLMLIILLLLSPFEGASKPLRSNENEKEKENEKKKEKKPHCQASLTLRVCDLKFFDEGIHHNIADNDMHSNLQTHDNSHEKIDFSNAMTVVSQKFDCLMRCLNRLGRHIFDNYTFTQHFRSKASSLPAPDQHLKSSTTYVLVRSRQRAF